MRRLSESLTYANVVSTLCLFLLLGGGAAYAASQLGRNSVGAKQLQNGSVTSAKVRDGALQALDFGPGQLPSGARGPAGPPGETGPPGPVGLHWDGSSYSVTATIANNSSLGSTNRTVACDPQNDQVIGGGFRNLTPAIGTLTDSRLVILGAEQQGWQIIYLNAAKDIASNVIVEVRCADFPPFR